MGVAKSLIASKSPAPDTSFQSTGLENGACISSAPTNAESAAGAPAALPEYLAIEGPSSRSGEAARAAGRLDDGRSKVGYRAGARKQPRGRENL